MVDVISSQDAILPAQIVPPLVVSTTRQRRVLHIINGEYYAGAERVQDLLGQHLPATHWDVGFACVKPDQFPRQRKCDDLPLIVTPLRFPWSRRAVDEIVRMIRDNHYDIVHSHTPRSVWAASRAAQRTGCPLVHTMHDVSLGQATGSLRRVIDRYTISQLRQADVVTTVSPATMELADRLKLGKQRRMILNGVAAARPGLNRVGPSRVDGYWNLGTVALIRPCKGIEVFIRAVARLRNRGCQVKATIVGTFFTPQYECEIMDLVKQLDVDDVVQFAGFSDDVPAFLESFDLFVMPSIGPEGLPMVLLESMAHGLPTIGSSVPGVADTVRPGIDGLLFPPGDDEALADAVDSFASGRVDWTSMSEAARIRHAEEFSVQRMASEFARVYNDLV